MALFNFNHTNAARADRVARIYIGHICQRVRFKLEYRCLKSSNMLENFISYSPPD